MGQTEKEESGKFFKSQAGKAFLAAVAQELKIVDSGGSNGSSVSVVLSEEQKVLVKKAIELATSREEIDFIERQLKVGNFEFLSKLEEGIDTSSTATPMAV
eukprot:GDKK01062580.1.p1 GENE.GDKK01062580.1~~GDKK01062580.1.p1  ORF type:complete len:101 (-),score=12.40 GDKK01062580.1:157-459(-)